MLSGLKVPADPRLLVGLATGDDAGVYLLNSETALIQTVDFFTPMVDEPFAFGRIAAANALSDVYAMGGRPLLCMNLLCCPTGSMEDTVFREILEGGLDAIGEAGALLVGGHSVEDAELKYGLSVTGVVQPERLLTNAGARPGDVLLLTKPLGCGVLATALKGGLLPEAAEAALTRAMATLNRAPIAVLEGIPEELRAEVHACTDVTGFGLIGHAHEMAAASKTSLHIASAEVPLLPEALEMAGMGMIPAGAYRNRNHYRSVLHSTLPEDGVAAMLAFDPQTSGGLLLALSAAAAEALLLGLEAAGYGLPAALIGRVEATAAGRIFLE